MSGIQQMVMSGGASTGLNNGATLAVVGTSSTGASNANIKLQLNTNGTVTASGNGTDVINSSSTPNWFLPTSVGIGSSYWVKPFCTGGTTPNGGSSTMTNNAWYNITSIGTLELDSAPGVLQTATGTLSFSLTNGGTVLATLAYSIESHGFGT
jgi:hypothetical protein